jgi:hypothetical protein
LTSTTACKTPFSSTIASGEAPSNSIALLPSPFEVSEDVHRPACTRASTVGEQLQRLEIASIVHPPTDLMAQHEQTVNKFTQSDNNSSVMNICCPMRFLNINQEPAPPAYCQALCTPFAHDKHPDYAH